MFFISHGIEAVPSQAPWNFGDNLYLCLSSCSLETERDIEPGEETNVREKSLPNKESIMRDQWISVLKSRHKEKVMETSPSKSAAQPVKIGLGNTWFLPLMLCGGVIEDNF